MDYLYEMSERLINLKYPDYIRYMYDMVRWNNRLIILKGARGVGKSTMLFQYIKNNKNIRNKSLYISLDSILVGEGTLFMLADKFWKEGGRFLFLDEVHKYPTWSQEIKNIYDFIPDLKVVATGSSAIKIKAESADLSRRAVFYDMYGLSFREYLELQTGKKIEKYSLSDILDNHIEIAGELSEKVKPFEYFEKYLKTGYYPFYKEDETTYLSRVSYIINTVMEADIPSVYNVDYAAVVKMKKFISIISETPPFKPNIAKLAREIGVSREILLKYTDYLKSAGILDFLYSSTRGMSGMNKPDKLFLQNTNLYWSLRYNQVNIGSLRETFVKSQLSVNHETAYNNYGDIFVDGKYTFEIGGKSKGKKQIKDIDNSYVLADDILIGNTNKIPVWLMGFMY